MHLSTSSNNAMSTQKGKLRGQSSNSSTHLENLWPYFLPIGDSTAFSSVPFPSVIRDAESSRRFVSNSRSWSKSVFRRFVAIVPVPLVLGRCLRSSPFKPGIFVRLIFIEECDRWVKTCEFCSKTDGFFFMVNKNVLVRTCYVLSWFLTRSFFFFLSFTSLCTLHLPH